MLQPTTEAGRAVGAGEGEASWLVGTLVTTKLPGDLTGNALAITEQLVPVGFVAPPHLHHVEDEIIFVLAGEIAGRCGEEPLSAGPGGLIFLPRGVRHCWEVVGTGHARLLVITTPAGYERFCAEAGTPATERALPAAPPDDAALAKLLAVAPHFGLEFGQGEE